MPDPLPISWRLEQRFLRQVRSLPADTQTLVLLAAADPTCDAVTLERAAERLGVPIEATGAAEEAGVLRVGSQITFRHPLIRSAVYSGATDAARRGAHQVLAAVIDPVDDADRVASHLAACAVGVDEDLASKLERSAGAAERRGSRTAALSLLIRSAELTPDVGRRGDRLLAAAQTALAAGNLVMARSLVADARPLLADPMRRAVAMRLEGSTLLPSGEDRPAARALLSAARAFEPLDPVMTRETLLEAMNVVFIAGRHSEGVDARAIAAMGLDQLRGVDDQRVPTDLLLAAFATSVCDGPQAALPLFRIAGEQLGSTEVSLAELSRWFQLGSYVARHLWDEELLIAMAHRLESAAREHGLLWALMVALASVASIRTAAGDFASAASAYAEHRDVGGAGGFIFDPRLIEVELTAWTGDDAETRDRVRSLDDLAEVYGSASLTYVSQSALAILELGQGHYAEAFTAAAQADDGGLPGWATKALPNMIEAGVRCGQEGEAAMALERLTQLGSGVSTPWALGTLARCRALLADPATAEPQYQEAVHHFSQTGWRTELARSHLVYGEWLRRRKRRTDARSELRTAHEMFQTMGAKGFAERARVELLATGERARSRRVDTTHALTPREAQIARLAAQRATSREIGAQLFISANTVDYHLRKIFQKLGVSSRREIARSLSLLDEPLPLPDGKPARPASEFGSSDDPGDTGVVERP